MATSRTQKLLKTRGERAQVGPPKVSVDVGSRFGHGEPDFGQTLRPPFGHGPPGFAKQSDRRSDTGPGWGGWGWVRMAAIYLAEIPNYRARLWCLWWGKEKTKKIAQKGKREERKREFSCYLLLFCIKSAKSGLRSQFQDDYQHSLIYYWRYRSFLLLSLCRTP